VQTRSEHRLLCKDSSGDPPEAFRELTTSGAAEQDVTGFFAAQLPGLGWRRTAKTSPVWTRTIGEHAVSLKIYEGPRSLLTVSATIRC
jgi:hypothetical protein